MENGVSACMNERLWEKEKGQGRVRSLKSNVKEYLYKRSFFFFNGKKNKRRKGRSSKEEKGGI